MRAAYDVGKCLLYLVPGAQFTVYDNDPERIADWSGGTLPTVAQLEAAWPSVQAQDAAAAQAEQAAQGNDLTLRQQAEAALVDLRIYRDRATTTTAQDKAAIKLLVRVAIGLVRLVLKRLDGSA